MLLARNPWGVTYYRGDWDATDSRWTEKNIAKVPNGLGSKVVTRGNYEGLFVIPIDKLIYSECFDGIDIAYQIAGYDNSRYDYENAPV